MGQGVCCTDTSLTCCILISLKVLVGDDNPPFEGVFEFCSISAGGSIGALLSLK